MPTKKKSGKKSGKKKKKTVPKSGDSVCDDAPPEDPTTAVSGESPKPKSAGKKKKKTKKKMTKSEKALAKLDKEAEKMRSSSQMFTKFVSRMDRWLTVYYPRAVELFRRFDIDGDGLLTYEEFKSGMYDLNAPCTTVELHLLARLLDEDGEEQIDYTTFTKGLQAIRDKEQSRRDAEERKSVLILSERTMEHCACCKLGLWHPYTEKYPKFVQVEMRLVTFDNFEDHPAHFTVLVHAHSPVRSLVHLVGEQTDIQSTTITVFSDPSRSRQAALPAHKTLEEVGFTGGSFDDPQDVTLFYDYTVEFTDCPLLLCDHYFGQKS